VRIDLKFDDRVLRQRMTNRAKRLAYNGAQALNETAKAVQLEERANLDRKFTIRKATFMYRLIKFLTFASARQGRPYAEIGVDPTKRRVLLGFFEKGGVKPPAVGKSVGVPVTGGPARPSFRQSVKPALWLQRLQLRRHVTSTGKTQFKGLLRSFLLRAVGGRLKYPGVFVRGGAPKTERRAKRFKGLVSKTAINLLYLFVPHPKLDARLKFFDVAKQVIAREWPEQFRRAFRRSEG